MTAGMRIQVFFLALSLLCLSAAASFGEPSSCPDAEWILENPLPVPRDLSAIWGTSADDCYVAGDGIILHYDGNEWSSMYEWDATHDELVYFEGVWGSSSTDVFAVGFIFHPDYTTEGVIYHYDGVEWTRTPSTDLSRLRGIWGSSASEVFVVGGSGTILRYDGANWTTMDSGTGANLSDVWGTSSSDVFAVGDEGTIYHYDGSAWSGMDAGTPRYIDSVWGSSGTDVWGGTEGYTMVHYDGTSWTEMPVEGGPYYKAFIWGSSANNVFVVGRDGGILHYDGVEWNEMQSGTGDFLFGVWGTASDDVFATGASGTIIHYDGSSWSHVSSSMTAALLGVWASSETDVFAAGGGSVYHYDGDGWSRMNTGTLALAQDVWGSAADDVFVAGYYGIHHYDGVTWNPMPMGMPAEPLLYTIWGTSANDVYTAGEDGVVYYYDGVSWTPLPAGPDKPVYGLGGSSSDDLYAVGFMGLLYHFDGATWSSIASGTTQHLYDVWASSPTDVFVVGGISLHYDGSVWEQMGLYGSDGVWGSSPTSVFATYGGRMMHYDGTDWTVSSQWVGQPLKAVFGLTECNVLAVGGGGAIIHYTDMATVPVLISHFEAFTKGNAVELTWEIVSDTPVAGFRIYRSNERDRAEHRLNHGRLIEPSARRYVDEAVQPGVRYRYILGVVDVDGIEVRSQKTEVRSTAHSLALFQNHPNPFNPATRIRFSIPEKTHVTLQIFNAEGKPVTMLIDRVMDPGLQEIEWDGRDKHGHRVASGVYFYRLWTGGQPLSRKMILLK